MSMDRRRFLKIVGASALLGLGGGTAFARVPWLTAGSYERPEKELKAKQWGMAVDMKKFRGPEDIRKCIDACHKLHNVPNFGNPKDEIKWIWTDDYEHSFPAQDNQYMDEHLKAMPFMVLCNHCDKPACVRVCPTKATFKRPEDGIVMMDYHRCIGCRFCMAACPYGARSFNFRDPRPAIRQEDLNREYPTRTMGVVEKCTFCADRLAKGEQPACVEAVKETKALVFGDLGDPKSEIRQVLATNLTIRRKPELGTGPNIYYVIGGGTTHVG